MIGWMTRRMLPHLSGVHVNRPLVTYRDWPDPGFVDAYDFLKLVHTLTARKMQKQNASTLLAEIFALAFMPVFCEHRKYIFACSNCLNVNANSGGCSKMANVPFSICCTCTYISKSKHSLWYIFYIIFCRLFAREDANHQVCIAGLTERHVHNVEELMEV